MYNDLLYDSHYNQTGEIEYESLNPAREESNVNLSPAEHEM